MPWFIKTESFTEKTLRLSHVKRQEYVNKHVLKLTQEEIDANASFVKGTFETAWEESQKNIEYKNDWFDFLSLKSNRSASVDLIGISKDCL